MPDARRARPLRKEQHTLSDAADEILGSHAGRDRQNGELTGAVVEDPDGVNARNDLDGAGVGVEGNQHAASGIRQHRMLGEGRLAAIGKWADVDAEAQTADLTGAIDDACDVLALGRRQNRLLRDHVGGVVTSGHVRHLQPGCVMWSRAHGVAATDRSGRRRW